VVVVYKNMVGLGGLARWVTLQHHFGTALLKGCRPLSYMFRHQGAMSRGVLDLRSFVVNKLPEDDTLVPKHIGAGT